MPPQPVTLQEIRAAFDRAGVGFVNGADRQYLCTTRNWMHQFAGRFSEIQRDVLSKVGYEPEANDCDDFAEDARYWARVFFRNTPDRPSGAALAMGKFSFQPDNGPRHAINVAACREPIGIVPVFFEPQRPGVIELSDAEKGSGIVEL